MPRAKNSVRRLKQCTTSMDIYTKVEPTPATARVEHDHVDPCYPLKEGVIIQSYLDTCHYTLTTEATERARAFDPSRSQIVHNLYFF